MPTSVPLGITMDRGNLSGSSSMDDLAGVVGHPFGADAMEQWADNGADLEDFQVLMAYGFAHAEGRTITFVQAAELVAKARQEDAKREAERAVGKPARSPRRRGQAQARPPLAADRRRLPPRVPRLR